MRNALRKLVLRVVILSQLPLRPRVVMSRQLPRSLHQLRVALQLANATQQIRRLSSLPDLVLQLFLIPPYYTNHLDRLLLLVQDLQTVHTVLQQV